MKLLIILFTIFSTEAFARHDIAKSYYAAKKVKFDDVKRVMLNEGQFDCWTRDEPTKKNGFIKLDICQASTVTCSIFSDMNNNKSESYCWTNEEIKYLLQNGYLK